MELDRLGALEGIEGMLPNNKKGISIHYIYETAKGGDIFFLISVVQQASPLLVQELFSQIFYSFFVFAY